MNYYDIALTHLFPYIGVTSLDPAENDNEANDRGLEAYDVPFAADCITAAFQEIFSLGPVAVSESRVTGVLHPPTTIGLTVTQYSPTVIITGYQSWMAGCTIQVGNDGPDNEVVSSTQLLRPYMGPSGSVQGTVYADAILVPSNVKNVMAPVEVPNVFRLYPMESRDAFRDWNFGATGHVPSLRGMGAAYNSSYATNNKTHGDPRIYFVESTFDAITGAHAVYIRLSPMPSRALPITYRVKLKPPVVTAAQIENEEGVTGIPVEWEQSILIPFAQKRFLKHPAFDNQAAAASIMDDYRMAMNELQSFIPQVVGVPAQYR